MEAGSEIKKSFETLITQKTFVDNIAQYTQSALQTIYNIPQSQQIDCPPAFVFILSHLLQNSQPLQSITSLLDEKAKSAFNSTISSFLNDRTQSISKVDNKFHNNLSDVQWQMTIQNGRQIWSFCLYTFQSEKPFVLKLNYEQLSIFAFQVNQIVSHVSHLSGDPSK